MKFKKSILKSTIFTVCVLIIVFTTLFSAVYFSIFSSFTQKEIANISHDTQYFLAETSDNLIKRINNCIVPLTNSYAVQSFNKAGTKTLGSFTVEDMLSVRSIHTLLQNMLNNDRIIDSIYIHYDNNDFVISSSQHVQETGSFFDKNWIQTYEKIKPDLKDILWVKDEVYNSNYKSKQEVLRYIFPLYGFNSNAAIVINITKASFSDFFKSDKNRSKNDIVIMNTQNSLVYTSDNILLENGELMKTINELDYSESDSYNYKIASIPQKTIITGKEDSFGNKIFSVVPYQNVESKYYTLFFAIEAFVVVLSIITGVTWYFISGRLYSPVREIIKKISSNSDISINDNSNDGELLRTAFETILDEYNKNKIKLTLVEDEMHFEELLSKQYHEGNELLLQKSYVSVMRISIDDYSDFLTGYDNEQEKYMKKIILKLCEEILHRYNIDSIGRLWKYGIELLISYDLPEGVQYDASTARNSDCREWLTGICGQVKAQVNKILKNTISITFGGEYDTIKNIPVAYQDAVAYSSYRLISGYDTIMFYSEISNKIYLATDEIELIINSFEREDLPEIHSSISTLVESIQSRSNYISPDNVLVIFNVLLCDITKKALSMNILSSIVFESDFTVEMHKFETIIQIGGYIEKIILNILKEKEKRDSNELEILNKASIYLKQNFNKDIDVNTIAENIGTSYLTLRKIMLDQCGINIIQYINKLRIAEAKRLLTQTALSVLDISYAVGYNSDQSLHRHFKKSVGTTPGEYRKKTVG